MAAEPWNLTVQEWFDVFEDGREVEELSKRLEQDKHLPWSDTLVHLTKDSQDILDLGSGRGELSATLATKGKNTTLLDWSNDNLEFSKRLYGKLQINGKFVQSDMTKPLPFEENSFDAVFSCGVFEYFDDNVILKIIKEMHRVARKRIIILVPNSNSIAYRIGKWYMELFNKWKWGGERPFSTLKPYFKDFTNITIREFTVGTKHSLKFLKMPCGEFLRQVTQKVFQMEDHAKPSKWGQGYLLITVGEITS